MNWSILWLKAPSLTVWSWRCSKDIFTKDQSVNCWIFEVFVEHSLGLKVPNHCAWGALGGLHGSVGGLLRAPKVLLLVQDHFHRNFGWLLEGLLHYFLITYSLCLWGLWEACQGPPGGPTFNQRPLFHTPIAIIILQKISLWYKNNVCWDILPQCFTNRISPGLSPTL